MTIIRMIKCQNLSSIRHIEMIMMMKTPNNLQQNYVILTYLASCNADKTVATVSLLL